MGPHHVAQAGSARPNSFQLKEVRMGPFDELKGGQSTVIRRKRGGLGRGTPKKPLPKENKVSANRLRRRFISVMQRALNDSLRKRGQPARAGNAPRL